MPKSQSEMIEFRVRNVNAAKQVWQPSGAGYQQPSRDHFGNGEKKQLTICGNTSTFQTLFHNSPILYAPSCTLAKDNCKTIIF